jgi:hypothetical protein
MKNELTYSRLREVLHYDPATGIFTWLVATSRRIKPGYIAGRVDSKGYAAIKIDHQTYRSHRLAFLYQTGSWPIAEIDHINGERANNAWCNLRQATRTQNVHNTCVRSDNKVGLKGVTLHGPKTRYKAKYRAIITVAGKQRHIGSFMTPEEAHAAYVAAATELFGEFARIGG